MGSRPSSVHRAGWVAVVLVLGVCASVPAHASTPAEKCRGVIIKMANEMLVVRTKARAICADRVLAGKLPVGACPDLRASALIDRARARLVSAIDKACGGRDKECGNPEGPDVPLGEIGWNIGSCAQTGSTVCTNPIADCRGVAACVTCIAERAADDAAALFADHPSPSPTPDKVLTKCLRALGIGSAKSLIAVAKGFGECWRRVSDRSSGGPYSCPDRKAASILGVAKAANAARVCDACGGADERCGGGDDYPLAVLGFAADCPAIGACGGPVQTVRDVANCADCVGHALMETAVRRTVPQYAGAPPPCTP